MLFACSWLFQAASNKRDDDDEWRSGKSGAFRREARSEFRIFSSSSYFSSFHRSHCFTVCQKIIKNSTHDLPRTCFIVTETSQIFFLSLTNFSFIISFNFFLGRNLILFYILLSVQLLKMH